VAGRLRRFLHLERPRGPDEDGPAPSVSGERFATLEEAPARPTERATGAATGRFGPEREPTLELVEVPAGEQPFRRCMGCGRDHGRYDTVCATCGAALDTPEQHAFNEGLWAAHQAEDARLAAEAAENAVRAAREAEELARLKREMGIELARQVGDRERARLGGGFGGVFGGDRGPLGVALLRALPERLRVKIALAVGGAWFVLLLGGLARRSPGALTVAIITAIALVVPRGSGRGRGRFGGFD